MALKAMGEFRWSDAAKHVAAIPESPLSLYAWKMYLSGWLNAVQDDIPSAEAALLQAASAALVSGLADAQKVETDAIRSGSCLAAASLDRLGCLYRRQERLDDACHAHLTAFHLYEEHGTVDERWDAAMNLAIDSAVARRDNDALQWCRTAIDLAGRCSERPIERQAQAWSRLSTIQTSLGRHDDAVAAARTARECWRKHDVAAVTAARADLELAAALMKFAESVYESECDRAKMLLNESLEYLASAADELPPFGPEAAADVRRCTDLTDFAKRLLDSL